MTLGEFFEEHHRSLFRFVSRMTGDPEFAKDIVQETFLKIGATWTQSGPQTKTGLFLVARGLALSALRKERRRSRLLRAWRNRVPVANPELQPDAHVERTEVRAVVHEALASLSERDRTIVLMREEGFTHREMAEAVGTPTGSVGTMLARAWAKLERQLEAHQEMEL